MLISFFLTFSICFDPKCTVNFDYDLWSAVNNLNCDGDALITINSQTISVNNWCNIGSWNRHVSGTLKIQGNGKVIVDGGFKITGWTPDTQNPNILKTTLDKTIHGMGDEENHVANWMFESLWVNDRDATRARVPGGWTLPTIKSVSTSGSGDFLTYTVGVPSNTMKFLQSLSDEELKNVNIVILHYWASTRAYIDSINTNDNTITFTAHKLGDNNKGIEADKAYFYLDNLKTALTKPGEWFLSTDGTLYYYPLPGETASNIEVYASHTKRLMYIETDNLILENIEFRHCGGNIPRTGVTREDLVPSSATLNMKCVDVYKSSNVQFINCSFRHVFCRALSIFECTSCVVEQCLVEDFGADGIAVGDSSNTRIYNNIIRHGGRVIHHENAFYDNLDPGAVISHNDISDNFWDGINCWLKDSECNMIIEKNHVHDIGFNLLDDIGCIYVTNAKKGVVIQNNYVHKAGCHNYGAWGLYVDLDCHEVVVQNNLAHDFYDGCVHFHYGFNNVAKNNILGFNKLGLMSKGQNNDGTMVTISNNIFITDEGNFYCDLWGSNTFNSYSNLYWDFGRNVQWFRDGDGKDNTGTLADPKFTDPLNRVFTFTDESVARGVGFEPFIYSDCGVVGDSWRKVASDYVIPPFPEKSTDDEALLSKEKVYPDYEKVITASQSPSATQSKSASQSPSATQSKSASQSPSRSFSASQSPSQPPSQSETPPPSQSETPPATKTPSSSPLNGYSNREFRGQISAIFLNDSNSNYRIENSKFIDCTLNDDAEYAVVVQAESYFNNVEFSFSNSKIGAIKIECNDQVTIENCVLTGCSVKNGNGNAIYVAQPSTNNNDIKSIIEINDCTFKNCGTNGYSFYLSVSRSSTQNSEINFVNSAFEFDSKEACSGIYLSQNNREVTLSGCSFNKCISSTEQISAVSIASSSNVLIEQCQFHDCSINDITVVLSIKTDQIECIIQNCTFDSNLENYLTGSPISVSVEGVALIGNVFQNCNANAVQIRVKSNDDSAFQLIDNRFVDCNQGPLISVLEGSFNKNPKIIGNAFENIHVDSELFIITLSSNSILFEESTFSNVKTKFGGFGGRISFSQSNLNSLIELSFIDCSFLDNSQETQGGGAFCSSEIQNNGNVELLFDRCLIQNNTATKFGGALYLPLISSVSIQETAFINNVCRNQGGAIFIDYTKSSKSSSLSLLSLNSFCSISSCKFEGNKADNYGNAIYINDARTDIEYSFENNTFENNYFKSDNVGYVIVSKSIDIDISNNKFSNPNSQVRVNPYMNIQKPPFKTPEPLVVENVYQNEKGEVDTSSFSKNNTEYLLQVTKEKVTLFGSGNPNFFLQIPKNLESIEIEETNATFGLKLDSNDEKNTKVKLKQEEANMNIKGGGNLTIETIGNITSLSIGDVTISQKENLQVSMKKDLDSFELGDMKMYGESSFDSNLQNQQDKEQTKAKSIKLFEGADSKLSNLKITDNIDIENGATISLSNVDLSDTKMTIQYSDSNQSFPSISGEIGNPPSLISLVTNNNNNVEEGEAKVLQDDVEQEVIIAAAPEDKFNNCDKWKDCVNLDGTKFKGVGCKSENGNRILYVSSSEVIQPTPKKKSILIPVVIGVACGVVVIVIVIVVVVVVVKKKRREKTSDVSMDTEAPASI